MSFRFLNLRSGRPLAATHGGLPLEANGQFQFQYFRHPSYVVALASTGIPGGSYQLTSVILTLMEKFDAALSAYPSSAASHDNKSHVGMEDLGDWDQLISVAHNDSTD